MSAPADDGATGLLLVAGLAFLALAVGPSEESPNSEVLLARSSAAERDAEALARMLSSETDDARARVVLGWITVHVARSWQRSVYQLLTGKSGKYGPQKYFRPGGGLEVRYASTADAPTPETARLAAGLLSGSIKPPELVLRSSPSAYVEMAPASKKLGPDRKPLQPEYTPEMILAKQASFGGIVGRIKNWFLYAKGAPPIRAINEAATV